MKLSIVMVGRTDRGFVGEGMAHYLDRLAHSAVVEQVVVAEESHGPQARRQEVEAERMLAAVRPGGRVVALDERGKNMTSPALAEQLGSWRDHGVRHITLLIGGSYGLHERVRERADLVLALSRMTFPHQLVRVVLAEQLYRAFSILQGRPYHH